MTRSSESWLVGCALMLSLLVASVQLSFGYVTTEEQEMMNWILEEGGQFKVTIGRNAAGVRGVFTTEEVKKGDTLIYIPDHLVLSVPSSPAAEAGPFLLKELFNQGSRFRPYLRILPSESEVLTGYNFPAEYIPYLADEKLEHQVRDSFKRHCRTALQGQHNDDMVITIPEAIGKANITLPYWEYVVSLLTSRTFSLRKKALSMVPLLDLVNHDLNDINQLDNGLEPGVRLIAGKDLAKGEEVTISYGNMRSDELLVYYGFVDMITDPPRLLAVDHRKHKLYDQEELEDDDVLTGPVEEVEKEMARLEGILTAFEARLAELGTIPQSNPYLAGVLSNLHYQRSVALRNELARLQAFLQKDKGSEL